MAKEGWQRTPNCLLAQHWKTISSTRDRRHVSDTKPEINTFFRSIRAVNHAGREMWFRATRPICSPIGKVWIDTIKTRLGMWGNEINTMFVRSKKNVRFQYLWYVQIPAEVSHIAIWTCFVAKWWISHPSFPSLLAFRGDFSNKSTSWKYYKYYADDAY